MAGLCCDSCSYENASEVLIEITTGDLHWGILYEGERAAWACRVRFRSKEQRTKRSHVFASPCSKSKKSRVIGLIVRLRRTRLPQALSVWVKE